MSYRTSPKKDSPSSSWIESRIQALYGKLVRDADSDSDSRDYRERISSMRSSHSARSSKSLLSQRDTQGSSDSDDGSDYRFLDDVISLSDESERGLIPDAILDYDYHHLHRGRRDISRSISWASKIKDIDPNAEAFTVFEYGPECYRRYPVHWREIDSFLSTPRDERTRVRWINMEGKFGVERAVDELLLRKLGAKFGIHRLAVEDVLNQHERTKVNQYNDHLFILTRCLVLEDGRISFQEVCMFLFADTVIVIRNFFRRKSITEEAEKVAGSDLGSLFGKIVDQLEAPTSLLRQTGSSFLMYHILDSIVNQYFPILDHFGDELEILENESDIRPDWDVVNRATIVKRGLMFLRRTLWPLKDLVDKLAKVGTHLLDEETALYMQSMHDDVSYSMEVVKAYLDTAMDIRETCKQTIDQRINQNTMLFTIIATIFLPLTFLTGVFGMNFKDMEVVEMEHGFVMFWGCVVLIILVEVYIFHRKGWLNIQAFQEE